MYVSLSQETRQYLIYSISLSSCPCSPLSIAICDLLILFAAGENRLQWFLQALAVQPQLSTNGAWQCIFLDADADGAGCLFFSLPLAVSHSRSNAGWHAYPRDSCPLWSNAWQAATELVLMLWVSWRVGAPGSSQRQGTDVEEGGDRSLQVLGGICCTGWTPERWSQGKRTLDVYKASNTDRRIASFCFHHCCYISSLISVMLTQWSSM